MSWRSITRRADKARKKRRPLFHCGSCGKRHGNPLGHVCAQGGGFKRKRAAAAKREKTAAARAKETAARQARRKREDEARRARRAKERAAAKERTARARQKKAPASRPARAAHRYQSCRDPECQRAACLAYREGVEAGFEAAGAP